MESPRSSAVGNKFVTARRSLSAYEQRNIISLFAKTGQIGGFVRSRGKSGVWELDLIKLIIFSAKVIVLILALKINILR